MQREILYSFFGTPYTMGINHDCLGNLDYTIPNADKTAFYMVVDHRKANRPYRITKYDLSACCATTAWIDYDEFLMVATPKFTSFIQAVAWLKKHVNELI